MSGPRFRPMGDDSHVVEYARKNNKKYRSNYDKIDWSKNKSRMATKDELEELKDVYDVDNKGESDVKKEK